MFTGIVEERGRVLALEEKGSGGAAALLRLVIEAPVTAQGTAVGDSISVNGVCLTVVAVEGAALAFEAVPETLRRTNLGRLGVGDRPNLERSVGGERTFGGHYVQGHVDTTAELVRAEPDGEARNLTFRPSDPAWLRYLVAKGYVTLDGASLTVVEAGPETFWITLIPHTQSVVTLGDATPGYVANLEVDVIGKYVERIVGPRLAALEARLAALER
ncbi:MAG: riboflavin synthase [Sandaracinaceae bacterium]